MTRPPGRPPTGQPRKVLRSIRLDPEVDAAIVRLGGSASAHVELAVRFYLRSMDPPQEPHKPV